MQAFGLFPLGDQAVVGRIDLIVGLEHGPGEAIDKLVAVAQALPNLCPRRAALIPLVDTFLAWAQATERKVYLTNRTEITTWLAQKSGANVSFSPTLDHSLVLTATTADAPKRPLPRRSGNGSLSRPRANMASSLIFGRYRTKENFWGRGDARVPATL